jgi:pimeloyl-ACP methyl ester carboxylesterase
MDDVRAVMDAVGVERAVLLGISEGGPMCMLFAATYPDRTAALALHGIFRLPRNHPGNGSGTGLRSCLSVGPVGGRAAFPGLSAAPGC